MQRGARVVRRRRLLRAWAVGGVAYHPSPPSAPAPDLQAKLKMLDDLAGLRERGALSDEEFAQQKQRVVEG